MSKNEINEAAINRLAELLDEHKLTEIEYEGEDFAIKVKREPATVIGGAVAAAPAAAPVAAAAPSVDSAAAPAKPDGHPVTSPMVGVIYCRPEPGAAEFCKVGQQVSEGDTLFLIEAMKTFNPVRAPRSGKVLSVMVEDGAPVEFGEVLMTLG
jgi:acetyl-CoA carboxylase biotin carboxyl carrier protein